MAKGPIKDKRVKISTKIIDWTTYHISYSQLPWNTAVLQAPGTCMWENWWNICDCGDRHICPPTDNGLSYVIFTIHLEYASLADWTVVRSRWLFDATGATSMPDRCDDTRVNIGWRSGINCNCHYVIEDNVEYAPHCKAKTRPFLYISHLVWGYQQ